MFRSRLLWKLFASYVVLVLVTTAMMGVFVARRIERDTLNEIRRSLRARAAIAKDVAKDAFRKGYSPTFQGRVKGLGEEIGTRFTIIRANGSVVGDSQANPLLMDNHANRPEIVAAFSQVFGTSVRLSNTVGKQMMYVALPVRSDGKLMGFVRTSLALSAIDDKLRHFRSLVFWVAGVSLLVAVVLGFFVARSLVAPLESMTHVVESVARGNTPKALPVERKDEVGKLARAFQAMASRLRRRSETIRTDRNKLLTVLGGMVEGVVAVDTEERLIHLNAMGADVLRAPRKQSVGKRIWEASRVREVGEALAETLRSGESIRRELKLLAGTGGQIIEMHVSPLHDGKGGLVGAVGVLHDLTRIHRLETVRRDFVANVSHELKTPITAVRGLVETLIEDTHMAPDTHTRFLEKIRHQAQRLSAIVTDLLALSRLESEKSVLEAKQLDLRQTIWNSARTLQSAADRKGITISFDVPKAVINVMGDDEALRQVVANLLDNAIKYTSSGGRVDLRLTSTDGHVVIEVQDTGVGIDPIHKDRIFERFYRIDKARSRELGGTGLGLSIVKHVTEAHGGEVSVESALGHGSTFRVVFPSEKKI